MKFDAAPATAIGGQARAAPRASRYSLGAIVLHWLIAALVLSTIPLGWYGASQPTPKPAAPSVGPDIEPGVAVAAPRPSRPPPKTPAQQAATNLHKTVGIVILMLTALRLGWRLTHRPPLLPAHMAPALRWAAKASHALFYLLLVAMPLSGWWMSSAVPDPLRHAFGFGGVEIPFLPVPRGWPSAVPARFVHTNLAWLMVGLAVLHIAAALKHHVVDRDDVLARMLPRSR